MFLPQPPRRNDKPESNDRYDHDNQRHKERLGHQRRLHASTTYSMTSVTQYTANCNIARSYSIAPVLAQLREIVKQVPILTRVKD